MMSIGSDSCLVAPPGLHCNFSLCMTKLNVLYIQNGKGVRPTVSHHSSWTVCTCDMQMELAPKPCFLWLKGLLTFCYSILCVCVCVSNGHWGEILQHCSTTQYESWLSEERKQGRSWDKSHPQNSSTWINGNTLTLRGGIRICKFYLTSWGKYERMWNTNCSGWLG